MNRNYQYRSFAGIAYALSCSIHVQAVAWLNPTETATSYLFAPGIHASERKAACYSEQYLASTGQLVCAKTNFVVLNSPIHSVNFSEIVLDDSQIEHLAGNDFIKPKMLFGSLYGRIVQVFNRQDDRHEGISVAPKEDSTGPNVQKPSIRLCDMSLSQEADIEKLSQAYDLLCTQTPTNNIVLYGVSRGAATAFNFMATDYYSKQLKRIRVAVLEGCFDSTRNLLFHRYNFVQRYPMLQTFVERIFRAIFSGHKFDGIAPIKVVEQFPHTIPVLFVTSKKDKTVPCCTTWNLYRTLRTAGHPHAYILELKHSAHSRYMLDDKYDKAFYESTVHAFYKKFDLPYNPELVELGNAILANCQPE